MKRLWGMVLLLTASPLHAAQSPGLQFLILQKSARSLGMGGASTALAEDAGAPFANPAGMAFMNRGTQMQFGMTQAGPDTPQLLEFSFLYPDTKFKNAWAISGSHLGVTSDGYDTFGNPTAGPSDTNYSLGLSYAQKITPQWALGATGIYASQNLNSERVNSLPSYSAQAGAFSLGALYVSETDLWKGGVLLYHWGSDVRFKGNNDTSADYPLPSGVKVGIASYILRDKHLTLAMDLDRPKYDHAVSGHLGAEYEWDAQWVGRLGLALLRRSAGGVGIIPAFGFRIGAGRLLLDFSSNLDWQGLGSLFGLAITWRFNGNGNGRAEVPVLDPEQIQEAVQELIQGAKAASEKGDLDRAESLLQKALALNSKNPEALFLSAQISQRKMALERLRIEREGDRLYEEGILLEKQENWNQALSLFSQAQDLNPHRMEISQAIQRVARKQKEVEIRQLQKKAASLMESDPMAAFKLCQKILELSSLEEWALKCTHQMRANMAEEAQTLNRLALEQYAAGNLDQAILIWKKAVEMDPSLEAAKANLDRAEKQKRKGP